MATSKTTTRAPDTMAEPTPKRERTVQVPGAEPWDMQKALFGLRGIIRSLEWLESEHEDEVEVRDHLLIAGRLIVDDVLRRI
jgi:hypothetical protein